MKLSSCSMKSVRASIAIHAFSYCFFVTLVLIADNSLSMRSRHPYAAKSVQKRPMSGQRHSEATELSDASTVTRFWLTVVDKHAM